MTVFFICWAIAASAALVINHAIHANNLEDDDE